MPKESIEIIIKVDGEQLDEIKMLPDTILLNDKEVSIEDCAKIASVFDEVKKLVMHKAMMIVNATVDKMTRF